MEGRAHVHAALEYVAAGVREADLGNVIFLPIDRDDAGRLLVAGRRLLINDGLRSKEKKRASDNNADDKSVKNDFWKQFIHMLMIADYNGNVRGTILYGRIPRNLFGPCRHRAA